ncbi:MAG: 3-oxoacyl-[acyl-carrier-protein] synthase III C-terminal domain-containing protein [Tistlia sp.]|uniref:type III polyketide synthase n=1 Tax=Tistlia sp. TaxID=3057121 RepID=UPI0034A39F69
MASGPRPARPFPLDGAAPRLLSLATAVPEHRLDRASVEAFAAEIFDAADSEVLRLLPAFANAGIAERRSALPLERLARPRGWRERHADFLETAPPLAERAILDCLAGAGLTADAVDALVVTCTTGFTVPSLDAVLMDRLDFRQDLQRLPVFGLGCAGGALGLARAAALARAEPGSRVLLLSLELCTQTFRPEDHSKSNIIACALFADGAAAALLSTEAPSEPAGETSGLAPRVVAWGERRWPDSLEVMGWHVEDDGLGVLFSADIPRVARKRFGPAADAFLAGRGLRRADLDGYVLHPGGAKVLAALAQSLDLPEAALADERAVLERYGNMSGPTVLFALARKLERGLAGRHLLAALGPGFTAGFVLLEG